MDVDRLAEIALELALRVRSEDPDDNGQWLLDHTTDADRWGLLFVLAAAGRTSDYEFRRATAFARAKPPEFVDDIAVERACRGERLPLNRLEQAAAVKRLAKRGVSLHETERILGINRRQVQRIRGGEVAWARDVA